MDASPSLGTPDLHNLFYNTYFLTCDSESQILACVVRRVQICFKYICFTVATIKSQYQFINVVHNLFYNTGSGNSTLTIGQTTDPQRSCVVSNTYENIPVACNIERPSLCKVFIKFTYIKVRLGWVLVRWGEVRCGELRWGKVRLGWVLVRWGEVSWGEVRWGEVRWGEVKWGEVLLG